MEHFAIRFLETTILLAPEPEARAICAALNEPRRAVPSGAWETVEELRKNANRLQLMLDPKSAEPSRFEVVHKTPE